MANLKKKLNNLPQKPGCYLFKHSREIIYVGKAKNLKKRVASYFSKKTSHKPIMVNKITNLEYIITSSEKEALFLEVNLIKKHQPKYNVTLKGGQKFVYIKITQEDFPRLTVTRHKIKDKARYFGPYLSAKNAKSVLKTLRKIIPFRICRRLPKKPCLIYHLGYCPAPCDNKISKKEYQKNIKKIIKFLRGNLEEVLSQLKKEMLKFSQEQKFEAAGKIRDKIYGLENIIERQKIVYPQDINQDIISLSGTKQKAVNIFIIRKGKITGKKNFILKNTENQKNKDILYSFINQYYSEISEKPKAVITSEKISDQKILEKVYGFKIKKAQRGKKFHLVKLGRINAKEFLKNISIKDKTRQEKKKLLKKLKIKLNLPQIPQRIEAYDISNIQGISPVGSMIVFEKGKSKKSDYRKFKIKTVKGINDPAMINEILSRRLKNKNWPKPDLIIIDGGRAQLNAALKVLKKINKKIPIISLAKRLEEIYQPDKKRTLILKKDSPLLYLLQNIRDEAHRFAINYFRKKHQKKNYRSLLDEIPGLGPKTKKKLLQKFGSVKKMRQAKKKNIAKLIGSHKTNILLKYL
ncbi:MAG: excinuclease ABC subunit UvrC [Patescibacteria group bacterium]|nr:excinuclease ABC subunit UvrC [Patescibacteria group bacterium]